MQILKRNGTLEAVSFDKIYNRIVRACEGDGGDSHVGRRLELSHVDAHQLVKEAVVGIVDGCTTADIDNHLARICANYSTYSEDYNTLAARLSYTRIIKTAVWNPRRLISEGLISVDVANQMLACMNRRLISEGLMSVDVANQMLACMNQVSPQLLLYSLTPLYDYFGLQTLYSRYLLRYQDGTLAETPELMFLRVATALANSPEEMHENFSYLVQNKISLASPILFNAGRPNSQLASCFLLGTEEDSLLGIYNTISTTALLSKAAGGVGIHVSNVRTSGSRINSTGGTSDGLVSMLKVFESTARYVNQGGKRKGAFAVYLEPWHADIESFLELRLNQGSEHLRTRDLFTALWVSDNFMQAVEQDLDWYLFCPSVLPKLYTEWGEKFEAEYNRGVEEKLYKRVVKARDIFTKAITSMIETGTPYILYKDTANRTSPHAKYGTIHSSNLCAEIIQYSEGKSVAVCTLASLVLPNILTTEDVWVEENQQSLFDATVVATRMLDTAIDKNVYPSEETEKAAKKHRALGIGIQGLADVFLRASLPFDSNEAKWFNIAIMRTIREAAKEESIKLGGGIQKNSLLTALMPTASTAQIYGSTESFEPLTSNLYVRRTDAGEFLVVNKYLLRLLKDTGRWNTEVRAQLIQDNGSVQNLNCLTTDEKKVFRTIWELPQKSLIDMAADRQPYVDQSQSMNLYFSTPSINKVYNALLYGWKRGLITGCYYLRSESALLNAGKGVSVASTEELACRVDDTDCESCSA